jgi:hypothetical protein
MSGLMEGVKTISIQPHSFGRKNNAVTALQDIVRKGR